MLTSAASTTSPADDPAYDRRFEMSTMDRNELVKGGRDLVAQAGAAGKTQQRTLPLTPNSQVLTLLVRHPRMLSGGAVCRQQQLLHAVL